MCRQGANVLYGYHKKSSNYAKPVTFLIYACIGELLRA